mmetsp:Transcript_10434/g.19518  ORF Transcript_10434/g.19518 Transcript_10434/m.19518 type:complete len:1240 (+) Transcript_10434:95-3814(+)
MDFNFQIDPGFFDTQFDYSSHMMTMMVNEEVEEEGDAPDETVSSSLPISVSGSTTSTTLIFENNINNDVDDDDDDHDDDEVSNEYSSRKTGMQQRPHQEEEEEHLRHRDGVKEIPQVGAGLTNIFIPHRGSLSRVKLGNGNLVIYALDVIQSSSFESDGKFDKYTLQFSLEHYTFLQNIFAVLDAESSGFIHRKDLEEFVLLRCPVFARRDRDLASCAARKLRSQQLLDVDHNHSPIEGVIRGCTYGSLTFDQVWNSVVSCALNCKDVLQESLSIDFMGIEGWILFSRFISLAQYYDAKRRFSARHLQTSGCGGGGGGGAHENQKEEVVIVELPPLIEPPMELSVENLIQFDLDMKHYGGDDHHQCSDNCEISLPELDLDHYYVAVHDSFRKFQSRSMPKDTNQSNQLNHKDVYRRSKVKVSVFAPTHQHPSPKCGISGNSEDYVAGDNLEFIITCMPFYGSETNQCDVTTTVRRSYKDLLWLHETFKSHKQLGGQLCGRILPPFPSGLDTSQRDVSSVNSAAVAVASASVSAGIGIVSTAAKTAKSLWGSLPGSKKITKMVKKVGVGVASHETNASPTVTVATSVKTTFSPSSHEIYGKELYETSESKARQIEKYLNYMLEHPALSTSFPLRIILKASQSGLDAAKQILSNQTVLRRNASSIADVSVDYINKVFPLRSSLLQCLPSPTNATNIEWVRTAAQAALILKVHGLLETAGYQSTSTKLQHASLPRFANKDVHPEMDSSFVLDDVEKHCDDFDDKDGISELGNESNDECDGFDLLPDPLPLPDRSALCAGSIYTRYSVGNTFDVKSYSSQANSTQAKDFYGSSEDTNLGEINVERDIERLRELLRRVSTSFGSCCNSLAGINNNLRTRELLHVSILRNIDSWEGMRGKILSQKALLNGISSLENSRLVGYNSFSSFFEDMIWLGSLASSAHNSAKDVCGSILAAKTAARAKHTAHLAVKNAIAEEEMLDGDAEASASHDKVQKCKMQELHAAVIEHEASLAKRHSVVSLAHDVKYWNVRRKQELLSACINVVKEQKSAAVKSLIAWNHLKDGLLDAPDVFVTNKNVDSPDVSSFVAKSDCNKNESEKDLNPIVIEGANENIEAMDSADTNELAYGLYSDYVIDDPSQSGRQSFNNVPSLFNMAPQSPLDEAEDKSIFDDALSSSTKLSDVGSVSHTATETCTTDGDENIRDVNLHIEETDGDNDKMTDSMQSLVDGLLTWGGGNWETEDDFEF